MLYSWILNYCEKKEITPYYTVTNESFGNSFVNWSTTIKLKNTIHYMPGGAINDIIKTHIFSLPKTYQWAKYIELTGTSPSFLYKLSRVIIYSKFY